MLAAREHNRRGRGPSARQGEPTPVPEAGQRGGRYRTRTTGVFRGKSPGGPRRGRSRGSWQGSVRSPLSRIEAWRRVGGGGPSLERFQRREQNWGVSVYSVMRPR